MVGGKRGSGSRGEVGGTENTNVPRSFIVKQGHVGSSLTQLVRDMRKVMEPNTAARLKERSTNKLKDFLVMAPILSVSHLLAFSLAKTAPTLRIARLPQGPTFSFRIERYSLAKDILQAARHPRQSPQAHQYPPLLVLSSFPTGPNAPQHLGLVLKCFQSLFPPLTPKTIPLSTARRVVLVSWNAEKQTIDVRHYLITVKTSGVSRRVRRIIEPKAGSGGKKIPDLSREKDIADYVLKAAGGGGEEGYETASTSAASDADPEEYAVRLASDYVGRNNRKGDKRAVKLDEIGPRMELRLIKIVEGPPGKEGGVLYHEFVKKSPKEVAALRKEAAERARIRKERREEQEKNVARKKKAAEGDDDDEDEGTDAGEEPREEEEDEGEDWDGDEDMSEGEDQGMSEEDVSESEEETEKAAPPRKRVKVGNATKPKGAIRFRK
ncbi:hypothetical protein FRC04_003983 [Tulasnella sp. 424]|nr:hypothetical protein FRC04_003983 [Tulasnella sp. 424]KAG8965418.1 hypothetical protein FRC05_003254 [Tulasnella sp. 425]